MNVDTLTRILCFVNLPYTIKSELHSSGQRIVYLAKNTSANYDVVVKVCKYAETQIPRIQREIKILQKLDSSYFPQIEKHTYITKDNLSTFVESFDPKTEASTIVSLKAENIGPFFLTIEQHVEHIPWNTARRQLAAKQSMLIDFMVHVFNALRLLWNLKIVHRDIKPDNILVRNDMVPVLIDLGIAKSLADGTINLTGAGFSSPCTPQYASPEQLQDRKTEVNYKSDQFSFAVVIYELLMGSFPYGAYNELGAEGLVKRMERDKRVRLVDAGLKISPDLASLIDRMLDVEQYRRFRDVDMILTELTRIRKTL